MLGITVMMTTIQLAESLELSRGSGAQTTKKLKAFFTRSKEHETALTASTAATKSFMLLMQHASAFD